MPMMRKHFATLKPGYGLSLYNTATHATRSKHKPAASCKVGYCLTAGKAYLPGATVAPP